jgi:hypothetical protein
MKIDCDKGMILALLRNWHPNRLLPQGVRLATLRPQLLKKQNYVCPPAICIKPQEQLKDDGKETHIDHIETVEDFIGKILRGELTFDGAYSQLWADSNVRAVHRECNYARNKKSVVAAD